MYVYFVSARVATEDGIEYVNVFHYSKQQVVSIGQTAEICPLIWQQLYGDYIPFDTDDSIHFMSINFLHEVPDE